MKAPVLAILFGAIWLPLQSAQAVDMQYGWKPGMSCKVQHSVKTLKGKESKVSFLLKTSPGPNGLLLVEVADMKSLDPKVPLSADPAKFSADDFSALILPNFLVNAEGTFMGLQDISISRAAARKMIERALGKDAKSPQASQVTELMSSEVMLANSARVLWTPLVTSWAGSTWEPDEHFQAETEDRFPIGDIPYKGVLDAHFVGLKPCGQKHKAAQCANLTTSQKPDPEGFKSLVSKMVSQFGGKAEDMKAFDLDLRMESDLLTHPETLVPVRLSTAKHLVVKGQENGKPFDFSGTERREWLFDCK
jgi:hypothetical protein